MLPSPAAVTHDTHADPLWPLAVILGDIALRVTRRKEEEFREEPEQTKAAEGATPAAKEGR